MKNIYPVALAALLSGGICHAGELGVGRDDPDAAPQEPVEAESGSSSFWQEIAEWFDLADSE